MELELDTLLYLLRQRIAITSGSTFVGEFGQVVGFELDAVELIVATQFLDFLLTFLGRKLVLTVLIAGKLIVELLFGELGAPLLLSTKLLRDGEVGHDGIVVETVDLHLIEDLHRVCQSLRNIAEDGVHLIAGLEPLLLGVEHTRGVIKVLACGETEQMVVGLSILLVDKVGIIGTDEFDAILPGQFDEHLVGLLLQGEGLTVGTDSRISDLMTLQLEVVVIAPEALVPLDSLTGSRDITLQDLGRHLTGDTGRAHDEVLMVLLQFHPVGTRTVIKTVDPGVADQFDEVLVTPVVLGKDNEVIATEVFLGLTETLVAPTCHIHLTAENRLERI